MSNCPLKIRNETADTFNKLTASTGDSSLSFIKLHLSYSLLYTSIVFNLPLLKPPTMNSLSSKYIINIIIIIIIIINYYIYYFYYFY